MKTKVPLSYDATIMQFSFLDLIWDRLSSKQKSHDAECGYGAINGGARSAFMLHF